LLKSAGKIKEISGCDPATTNNRMELLAVISALEALKTPCLVRVCTDSTYVVKGMKEWVRNWIRNNWKNSQRKEVLNRDLWERLLAASKQHEVEWLWVKGHNGHIENEFCDSLARKAIEECREPCLKTAGE